MKKMDKKKLLVIIFALIALTILTMDLLLFWNSQKETGSGQGFSRYWKTQQENN